MAAKLLYTVLILVVFEAVCWAAEGNSTCSGFKSCEDCVSDSKCYWCTDLSQCYDYDVAHVSSYFEHCGWGEARWKHCWLNVMALVISSSVIGFIILVALIVVCCWCRRKCNKRSTARMQREESELERREEERKERSETRKAERSARTNEIRQKYGLLKEDD